MSSICLALICFSLGVLGASGAPTHTERSRRSTDMISDLHTKLRLLHQKIHDLVAAQEHQQASATKHDVNKVRGATEAQMTSEQQKQVQMLSKHLDAHTQADQHEIAETLDQLLRETMSEKSEVDRTNTAGEYLGDTFKEDEKDQAISQELQTEADTDKEKKEEQKQAVKKEDGEDEEKEAEYENRLQMIYNMAMKLYNQQHHQNSKEEEEEEAEEEKPAEPNFVSRPDFLVDEGTFGDFVDTKEESRSSAFRRDREEMRTSVLNAIEKRLLQDLQDARDVGISIDDIIDDIHGKLKKEEHLRRIEIELNRLSPRD